MTRGTDQVLPSVGVAVLAIDHDPDQLALLTAAFRASGLRIIAVTDAKAALEALAFERIGCVVADVGIPGTGGIDLVRALRRQPDTATLPYILTSDSVDTRIVMAGFDAGADDFISKAVHLDELVARVHAHLRTQSAWDDVVVAELDARGVEINGIGQLALSSIPEEAARAVVAELANRVGSAFAAVYRVAGEDRLDPLATWSIADGVHLGGPSLSQARSRRLIDRAREGPWFEPTERPAARGSDEEDSGPAVVACAPIYAGDVLVGVLRLASAVDTRAASASMLWARLLGSAVDYASVLGAVAGPAIADDTQSEVRRANLREILRGRQFFPVYQPIVALSTGRTIGFEALIRFTDGTPPGVMFEQATAAGLRVDFEIAAIEAEIAGRPGLAANEFLSLNVSPELVMKDGKRLRRALARWHGPIVLEITEHAPIADYETFCLAVGRQRNIEIAIDDAGAGYASLRHILEIKPAWVKLDITLVRGIDTDPLRQALVAGLIYFAARTGERLIAEGVERQEEADTLSGIGVEFAQGYLFGRPARGTALEPASRTSDPGGQVAAVG